jgi:hypothetical protein
VTPGLLDVPRAAREEKGEGQPSPTTPGAFGGTDALTVCELNLLPATV